jgi:hypothetical protein
VGAKGTGLFLLELKETDFDDDQVTGFLQALRDPQHTWKKSSLLDLDVEFEESR